MSNSGYEPRCKICKNGQAQKVNNMLVLGYTYQAIVDILNEEKGHEYYKVENVFHHKKHLSDKIKLQLLLKEKQKHEQDFFDFFPKISEFLAQFIYAGAGEILGGNLSLKNMTKDLVDKWLKAIDLFIKSGQLGEKELELQYQSLARAFQVFSEISKKILTNEQKKIVEREYEKAKDYIDGESDVMPTFSLKEITGETNE